MAGKNGYVTEDHEGKRYRVRDKNYGPDEPCIVWGSDLEHEEAHKLKERVVGSEKSTTARIENMDVPLPPNAVTPKGEPLRNEAPAGLRSPLTSYRPPNAADAGRVPGQRQSSVVTPAQLHRDPQIAEVQRRAMAAVQPAAAEAQGRSDNLIALPQHPHPNDALPFAPEVPEGPAIEVPEDIEADIGELLGESDAASIE